MIQACLLIAIVLSFEVASHPLRVAASENEERGWKAYTNTRFGFSIRYPENWRLGNPLPDGAGVTLYPPIDNSLVAVSGHMNILEGKSQDRRQTLDEFATAHRRIITELYGNKAIAIRWRQDRDMSLAGSPAKELAFTYPDATHGDIIERHIFSLGRNEGRGIRIKVPLSAEERVMQTIMKMLETYQPGRDQNAISPLVPKPDSSQTAPHP
ncbi:MAG TPA: hypothetical protein VLA67_12230 [Nitrospiraceae bacterium]|nr:hypothetical protein [Nitrospiraceae bacterium]